MGRSKKPSRKADCLKAIANLRQWDEHQVKIKENPRSPAIEHWKHEKDQFITRANYHMDRAGVTKYDLIRKDD
jgi:hypothetical protein